MNIHVTLLFQERSENTYIQECCLC